MSNLKPQIGSILEASKPVQKYLGIQLDEEREQLEMAKYLPQPLFLLFSETRAFAKACDANTAVKILGDVDDAKAELAANLRKRMAVTGDGLADEDEEQENDEAEAEVDPDSKKSKASGKAKSKASQADKLKAFMATHPLSVEVVVKLRGDKHSRVSAGNAVNMTFSYLKELEVVAMKPKLILDQECKSFTGEREVLQGNSLLSHLLITPDDGTECPNPMFPYLLKKAGVEKSTGMFAAHGLMYQWVQHLAGLRFPEVANDAVEGAAGQVAPDAAICQLQVEKTIEAIRDRLLSRIVLQREVSTLEKTKLISSVDLQLPERMKDQFPGKQKSRETRKKYTLLTVFSQNGLNHQSLGPS